MKEGIDFEYDTCLRCTAMSAKAAMQFFGGSFFKVVCTGQALGPKFRFGARHYKLFRTEAEWKKHQAESDDELLASLGVPNR